MAGRTEYGFLMIIYSRSYLLYMGVYSIAMPFRLSACALALWRQPARPNCLNQEDRRKFVFNTRAKLKLSLP